MCNKLTSQIQETIPKGNKTSKSVSKANASQRACRVVTANMTVTSPMTANGWANPNATSAIGLDILAQIAAANPSENAKKRVEESRRRQRRNKPTQLKSKSISQMRLVVRILKK
jgi:hypothetical protein